VIAASVNGGKDCFVQMEDKAARIFNDKASEMGRGASFLMPAVNNCCRDWTTACSKSNAEFTLLKHET
jgi:hypothetical protein